MRLTVFGGTGPLGQLVIADALAAGHQVIAYARNPDKLETRDRLSVVPGQLDDAVSISAAIAAADAVISLLGPSTSKADAPAIVTGTRNIVAGMHERGVSRLVAIATPSVKRPEDGREFAISAMVALVKRVQRAGYDAIVATGDVIVDSGLDWTLVRVPLLTNRPPSAASARRIGGGGGTSVARANVAEFILTETTARQWVHGAPLLSDQSP